MKCPNCGNNISIYFTGIGECDGEFRHYFEGVCDNCGKNYEWADVYEFTCTTPPHEIDVNDHL